MDAALACTRCKRLPLVFALSFSMWASAGSLGTDVVSPVLCFGRLCTPGVRRRDLRPAGASFEGLAENLASRLTVAAILANAGGQIMLHACRVASPETGGVVALVAKSGTGKTTAASVLARTYGYVKDETVAMKSDREVILTPSRCPSSSVLVPKLHVGPDELGLQQAPTQTGRTRR